MQTIQAKNKTAQVQGRSADTGQKYETGASSHAVNDLILFTDNTRSLVQYRDQIYKARVSGKFPKGSRRVDFKLSDKCIFDNGYHYGWHFRIETREDRLLYDFINLLHEAQEQYKKEFPAYEDHKHISELTSQQQAEFCQLYAEDFDNWKLSHDLI